MPKPSSKDENQLAAFIVHKTTDAKVTQTPKKAKVVHTKNPHAMALGRLGGLKGGKARAEKLSAAKRRAIAQKAANSRWNK